MSQPMDAIYQEVILKHHRSPKNRGPFHRVPVIAQRADVVADDPHGRLAAVQPAAQRADGNGSFPGEQDKKSPARDAMQKVARDVRSFGISDVDGVTVFAAGVADPLAITIPNELLAALGLYHTDDGTLNSTCASAA